MARQLDRRVLALACGTGRIALPLAGLNVVGVDRSEAMLAVARRKLAAASPSAPERLALLNQDMSEFDLDCRFGFAFVPAPLNYRIANEIVRSRPPRFPRLTATEHPMPNEVTPKPLSASCAKQSRPPSR